LRLTIHAKRDRSASTRQFEDKGPKPPSKLKPTSASIVHVVTKTGKEKTMGNLLYWAVVFLIVALVAALLGFVGVAGVAMEGARLLFWVAIVLFIVALIGGLFRRGI
jgi:uncharacterized membrane protein YtjA (UPF0391 family)